MPVIDKEPIPLPGVEILEGVNLSNPMDVNLLVVHQEDATNKSIKQYKLTYIADKLNDLKKEIGTVSTDEQEGSGLHLDIEKVNQSIDDILDIIGTPKADSAEGTGSGLYALIEDLQTDRDIVKNKYFVEGYKIHFISPKNKVNLLYGDTTSKYEYTFSDIKEDIATCISNQQNYSVNMHLGLTYTIKNSTLGTLSTNVTVNLNAAYANKDRKAVVYIPVADAVIGLKFTFNSNNKITFTVSDTIGTGVIKSDELWVQHGVLEFNKLGSTIPSTGS